jgi:hypothetical protein
LKQIFEESPGQIKVINPLEGDYVRHTKDKKLCHLFQQAILKHITVSMKLIMKQIMRVSAIMKLQNKYQDNDFN